MFKTKEIKTRPMGEKLKSARESMKMALWQASKKTKIPINYLKYLEEGNYKGLPADIYIVAYLKKYVEILNLDVHEILKQFKIERGVTEDLSGSSKLKKNPLYLNRKFPLVVTPKRLSLVFVILIIVLVFGYFWHQLSYLIYPPRLKIDQPAYDLTTLETSIKVSGQTESDINLTINGKEVYVDNKGSFSSVVSLEFGLNILKIEAKDRFGKINSVIRRVMVTK